MARFADEQTNPKEILPAYLPSYYRSIADLPDPPILQGPEFKYAIFYWDECGGLNGTYLFKTKFEAFEYYLKLKDRIESRPTPRPRSVKMFSLELCHSTN